MSFMIVTRFAPSPTGYLHVGGLRTALYAYFFAKQHSGKIILRIEDTDQKRQIEGAEENLIKTLEWAGIHFDEDPKKGGENSPYRQSERTSIYKKYSDELISSEKAYRCFCTQERLENLREKQEVANMPSGYDGYCRNLTERDIEENFTKKIPFVIRLKVPKDQWIIFEDIIRGKVKFSTNSIDDQILLKSDEFPTYHLANVVDDHLMRVTHVIRGEEWLPSTPKHILLYQAFDWKIPQFAHLPLILNVDRSKLSKRQGDVAVEDYMKKGYEKEELINFIAFLGWNPGGTREIYSLDELIQIFDLKKVQKGGAIFNIEKLLWYRSVWRQRRLKEKAEKKGLSAIFQETKQGGYKIDIQNDEDRYQFAQELYPLVKPFLKKRDEKDEHFLLRCLYIVRDKIIQEPEKVEEYIIFYYENFLLKKELFNHHKMQVDKNISIKALQFVMNAFTKILHWNENFLKQTLIQIVEQTGLTNGQIFWPVRAALTRVEFSPGAFESAWILGREKTLKRLEEALQFLAEKEKY